MDRFNWQGYAMTKGRFSSQTREDLAVSAPRANNYFGQINIITNNNGLDYQGQSLTQANQVYGIYSETSIIVTPRKGLLYIKDTT